MESTVIVVMAGLVLVYSLVGRRLTLANVTAPMLSVIAGAAVFAVAGISVEATAVHLIAEITLVLILFHDASTVRLAALRHDSGIAVRLLVIGFPLALIATFLATHALLPTIGVAGAWLVAAAITPTDAGLGAPTVLNPVVPTRVRRALNVESGLNDGLATPIVLLALAALATEEGAAQPTILQVGLIPVGLALASAVAVGLLAAWLLDRSRIHHLSGSRGRAVAILMLPVFLFGLAEVIGANAFIAAFVGGLVFGAASTTLDAHPETSELLEIASDLLGFLVWFFAGGILLAVIEAGPTWQMLAVAVLALTVLRIVPVFLALLGTGFKWPTVTFLGWFGPRGLATIVFGLLAYEELGVESPVMGPVAGVIAFTVLISVFAHGVSAAPLSKLYGDWARRTHAPIEREPSVEPTPSRGRAGL